MVTRAADQAGRLTALLEEQGAAVLEIATIAIEAPVDGGAALADAVAKLSSYEWVVVTSVNGAARLADALGALRPGRLAAVGPGTAEALAQRGLGVDLVPARALAEGLLDELPPPHGTRRLLLAQADRARPVLADGLRASGWQVDAVTAYRTVARPLDDTQRAAAAIADAVTFTSASTVEGWVGAGGLGCTPNVVVCIGPVTAEAAHAAGLSVTRRANPHTLEGLVSATVSALSEGGLGVTT
ncbi:MAG TPA: uroporphyrinogen-III synthase [Acidimicrobiales bacterium]